MNSKNKIVILIMLVLAAVIAGFVLLRHKSNTSESTTSDKKIENEISQTKNLIEHEAKISFPGIKNSEVITKADIPSPLMRFFTDIPDESIIRKVIFDNGKPGFSIDYRLTESVESAYRSMLPVAKTLPFAMRNTIRTDYGALIETENKQYVIKLIFEYLDLYETKVLIQIIELNNAV